MKKQSKQNDNVLPIQARRAIGSILPICLAALLLSGLIVSVANDMYAFVKPDEEIAVSLDAPVSAKELSRLLQSRGVIKNGAVFGLYLRSKGKLDKLGTLTGEWTLNSSMSYREILLEIF